VKAFPAELLSCFVERRRLDSSRCEPPAVFLNGRLAMNQPTKTFPLQVLLTVTTGRLLTDSKGDRDNGIGDLYEILGWMTNDSPYTHQLGRFAEECRPWLFRWFPKLGIASASASLASLDQWVAIAPTCPDQGVMIWLAELRMMQPKLLAEYDVPRIPVDDHERKHPYDELVAMRGTDEGIVIVSAEPQP